MPGNRGNRGKRGSPGSEGVRGNGGSSPGKDVSHWEAVAQWYDQLVGDQGSEYHRHVVFPGLLGMVKPRQGMRVLDVACGQGAWCRLLRHQGCEVVGVDAAASLVRLARERSERDIAYHVGDAQELGALGLPEHHFDAATCVLAIQNIPHVRPVCQGVAQLLKPGGCFHLVMMHPAFRGPKITGWDWHDGTQRRWASHYLSPRKTPIVTHPGKDPQSHTWTFHRPLQHDIAALSEAGLLVRAICEWPSHKHSDSGPRAAAENLARQEIPMFMAITAVKVPASGSSL